MREAGAQIARHFGDRVRYHGFGNERGNADCWLPIRFDVANTAGAGPDMVRERAYPEETTPYTEGVLSVRPAADFISYEADGADILRRLSEADPTRDGRPKRSGFHPYANGEHGGFPDGSYFKIEHEYLPVIQRFGDVAVITEISDEGTGRFAEWLAEVAKRYPFIWGVFVLQPEWEQWFVDWWGGDVRLTAKGEGVRAVVEQIVAKPSASPAPRRRAARH